METINGVSPENLEGVLLENTNTAAEETQELANTAQDLDTVQGTKEEEITPKPEKKQRVNAKNFSLLGDRQQQPNPTQTNTGANGTTGDAETAETLGENAEQSAIMYVSTLEMITGMLAGIATGEDAEIFAFKPSAKKAYTKNCIEYFKTLKNTGSPSFWFAISTVTILGGILLQVLSIRKRKAAKLAGEKTEQNKKTTFTAQIGTPTKTATMPTEKVNKTTLPHEVRSNRAAYQIEKRGNEFVYLRSPASTENYLKKDDVGKGYYSKPSSIFLELILECNNKGYDEKQINIECRKLRDDMKKNAGWTIEDTNQFIAQNPF